MLEDIKKTILSEHDLGKSIVLLERQMPANPADTSLVSRINGIRDDYRLMCDYALRGFKDQQAESIYGALLRRAYEVCNDLELRQRTQKGVSLLRAATAAKSIADGQGLILETLERFVQDIAVASLADGEGRDEAVQQLHTRHQQYVSKLFGFIVVSGQWSDSMRRLFGDILLSPLVDGNDALQMASAITVAATNVFDINKWMTLADVFAKTAYEPLRQRCLVGWVLALPQDDLRVFPEVTKCVRQVVVDDGARSQLLELQMQLFYCCSTEADSQSIQREIIPTLVKNNDYVVTRAGIVEKEEDTLNEILDPGAADRRMEEMERSFNRMLEMQKAGSDIYFGGFSQMKRFAFFEDMSNWFCPFYTEHPQLQGKGQKLQKSHFMQTLLQNGPFCESDKYSFALAMATVIDRLPDKVKEALSSEGASLGGAPSEEERTSAAYVRRMYLQDVYRFFRLFQYKTDFRNPFDTAQSLRSVLFFANPVFKGTPLEGEHEALLKFLYKRKAYDSIVCLGKCCPQEQPVALTLVGMAEMKMGDLASARMKFNRVLGTSPKDEQALKGLASVCFSMGDFIKATECYALLVQLQPANRHYALNHAISQVCMGSVREGLATLFRLGYEMPDDPNVRRALAWGHLLDGKAEKAEAILDQLTARTDSIATDFVNAGYAKWFQSKVSEAVLSFQAYLGKRKEAEGKAASIRSDFKADRRLLEQYGIGEVEQHIMCDLVASVS